MSDARWRARKLPKGKGVKAPQHGLLCNTQQEAEDYAREQSRKNGHAYEISYRSTWEYVTTIQEKQYNPNSAGARLSRAMRVLVRSGLSPDAASHTLASLGLERSLGARMSWCIAQSLETHKEDSGKIWEEDVAMMGGDPLKAAERLYPEVKGDG